MSRELWAEAQLVVSGFCFFTGRITAFHGYLFGNWWIRFFHDNFVEEYWAQDSWWKVKDRLLLISMGWRMMSSMIFPTRISAFFVGCDVAVPIGSGIWEEMDPCPYRIRAKRDRINVWIFFDNFLFVKAMNVFVQISSVDSVLIWSLFCTAYGWTSKIMKIHA